MPDNLREPWPRRTQRPTLDRIIGRSRPQPVVTVVRDQSAVERLLDLTRESSAVTSTFDRADEVAEEIVLARLTRLTDQFDDSWEAAMNMEWSTT